MRRELLSLFLTLAAMAGSAQEDASLTREFDRSSPKERARIAKKEQEEAAKDVRYQAVMAEAEDLFRQQRYDDALDRFQEARRLRPLNVYPKVKIQDLQALIAKREAGKAGAPPPPDPASVVVPAEGPSREGNVREPVRMMAPDTAKPAVKSLPKPLPQVTKEPRRTMPVAPDTTAPVLPDGIEERMYMEGRSVVIERKVTVQGRTEVFRRVTHPWGQVNHFRDGIAISERAWEEAGGSR